MSCSFCGKEKVKAKGFCSACYQRYLCHGSPERIKIKHICTIEGCNNFVSSFGLCTKHDMRKRRLDKHSSMKCLLPLYSTWQGMIGRCRNPNNISYQRYGGRGITVCDKWINDFDAFAMDMGEKPTPEHTIDRIDGTKGYYPENCRWATPIEQSYNSTSRILDAKTVIEMRNAVSTGSTIVSLAKKYNCSESAVTKSVYGDTWKDIPGAIDTQLRKKNRILNKDTVMEIRRMRMFGASLKSLAEKYSCSQATVSMVASGKLWKEVPMSIHEPINNEQQSLNL